MNNDESWLNIVEEHLRIVRRAEKRRHMEEIIKLTLEVERLRAERDAILARFGQRAV